MCLPELEAIIRELPGSEDSYYRLLVLGLSVQDLLGSAR